MDFQNFMNPNATPELQNQIATAYQSGDIGTVNNLLSQNNITADQANNIWGSGIANTAIQQGVNFAPNPTTTVAPLNTLQNAADQVKAEQNYSGLINNAYAGIGRTGIGADASNIDQGGFDYWKNQLASGALTPETFQGAFNNAVDVYKRDHPTDAYTNYVNNWQQTQQQNNQVKDFVSSVLSDTNLSYSDKVNQIINHTREIGFDPTRLESIYGKDKTQPFLDTYRTNLNNFINTTLAKEPGTTLNELGALHKGAVDNKWTVDDLVKYGGLNKATAQSYFDQYDQGLGNIVAKLLDPKATDADKAQMGMYLNQNFGTTDEELAKASKGKWKTEDVKAYMAPVRNFPSKIQELMADQNATAQDITKALTDAKADARIGAVYGTALDKALADSPELWLRDIRNGSGNLTDNYNKFLTQAKATPASAAKYAPQIAAVENILKNAQYTAKDTFGGKVQDYQLQIMSQLPQKAIAQMPKQLEFNPPTIQTVKDEDGKPAQITVPGDMKSKGISPEYTSDEFGYTISGYRSEKPVEINGEKVYATYDLAGKLTGYDSDHRQRNWLDGRHSISGSWDVNGNPKPMSHTSRGGGFFKNTLQDIASIGPAGQIALMAATGGLGSLAAGSLMSAGLSPALASALGAGLVSGTLSEVGGGNFGKGFAGGAIGSGVSNLAGSYMPTNVTGNTFVDSYLTKAAPNVAGAMARTGVMGGNLSDAGLGALLNTGVNMGVNAGTNTLLGETGMDKLGALQPYATGVASNLITSALTGKNPNVQNALTNTVMQQAMQTGKQAIKG